MRIAAHLTRIGISLALGAGLLAWAGPGAIATSGRAAAGVPETATTGVGARILRACVNKRTGEMRLVKKGKCRRGERIITWSSTGPQGPAGPTGPRGYTPIVRDGTGVVVTDVVFVGSYAIERLVDGGIFRYWMNGQLSVTTIEDGFIRFLSADCSGPLQVSYYEDQVASGYDRVTVRGPDGVTKTTYTYTAAVTTVAAASPYSSYQTVGGSITCVPGTTGTSAEKWQALVALGPAPPDLPGPLLSIAFS